MNGSISRTWNCNLQVINCMYPTAECIHNTGMGDSSTHILWGLSWADDTVHWLVAIEDKVTHVACDMHAFGFCHYTGRHCKYLPLISKVSEHLLICVSRVSTIAVWREKIVNLFKVMFTIILRFTSIAMDRKSWISFISVQQDGFNIRFLIWLLLTNQRLSSIKRSRHLTQSHSSCQILMAGCKNLFNMVII